jgi:hypothetical protein
MRHAIGDLLWTVGGLALLGAACYGLIAAGFWVLDMLMP